MDNDDGLTYEHEGKQLAFKVEELLEQPTKLMEG
jgi:hypothetical protein